MPKIAKKKKKSQLDYLDDFSQKTIKWIGSIHSLFIHSVLFIFSFGLILFGVNADKVLLVVTTIVSLEAIYLAIFIQMSVNRNSESLAGVEKDIDEIQKDVDEIEKDVDEIQKDVDEIQEDIEDIEESQEEDEVPIDKNSEAFDKIEAQLQTLIKEIENIRTSVK